MNKHVLVVDDDTSIVEVITIILKDAGYTVSTATDGKTMGKIVAKQKPDVILLDIWMAGEDGQELARILKNNEKTKRIPIIMISAHSNTRNIAKEAGVDGFLAKPFDMSDLLFIVHKYSNLT